MERRRFVGLAGGMALGPLFAWAQRPEGKPLVGMLFISNAEPIRSMFLKRMAELGHVDGSSIRFEYRNAMNQADALATMAADLVRMKVDVIVAVQTPAAHAARKATATIPIIVIAGDPVGTGLVASLSHPGGNLTGFSPAAADIGGKLLELLREVRPALKRVAVLANRNDPFAKPFLRQIEDAGAQAAIGIVAAAVAAPAEFAGAFAAFARQNAEALIVQPSLPRKRVLELATQYRFASISPSAAFATDGGLLAYSTTLDEQSRSIADYVDKVLKGARPAELPIRQPTLFELAVNRRTANAIGLAIPQSVLVRADRIID